MSAPAWKSYALAGDAAGASSLMRDDFEGRVEAQWFSATVDRKRMKALMKRSDGPALVHFGLWIGLMVVSGAAAALTWGSWRCVPCFAVYGTLYAGADHRAHELSHGTPFRTRWINELFYHLAGFMTLHEGYYWRWSHTRHHTDTVIVGRDPEIAVPRPPSLLGVLADFFFLKSGAVQLANILRNATGRLNQTGRHFIPEDEVGKVVWSSRGYVAIFLATGAACWAMGSILPAMLVVLPRFYGGPLPQLFNITQHAGLAEDVHDHRLNTRTFLTNPVFRFLYVNMNYHIEHHMFPMVPYHALPQLHEMIKDQCPAPYPSVWACWREIVPALLRQKRDPAWCVERMAPADA